jgi:hypothetical protein
LIVHRGVLVELAVTLLNLSTEHAIPSSTSSVPQEIIYHVTDPLAGVVDDDDTLHADKI